MSKQVLYDIQGMIRECKDKKNPNRVREHYKKELTTIFNTIDKVRNELKKLLDD